MDDLDKIVVGCVEGVGWRLDGFDAPPGGTEMHEARL